jgi:predicted negative regulator of RcsB-dependent stress response
VRTQHLYRERLRLLIAENIVEHRTVDAALQELRELVADDSIAPYGLRMLAALELDRGEHEAARHHLQQAIARRKREDIDNHVDQLLIAHAWLGANEPSEALSLLDTLLAADQDRAAAIEQARGDALSALGRLEEARRAYEHCAQRVGNQLEDRVAAHLDIAYLELERDRPDAAITAIDAVLGDEPSGEYVDDGARRLRARLRLANHEHERALADLRAAIDEARDPARTRERVANDPDLAELREHPSFAELLHEPRPAARWLDAHPPLVALREHAGLRERGVQFLDEQDAREGGDALREFYGDSLHLGTLWIPPLWEECRRIAKPLWLLGKGPAIPGQRHAGELTVDVVLYVDPEHPDTVWLGPDDEFPAALFTELPSDGDAIAAAIDALYLNPPMRVQELPCVVRAFMGYPNQLGVPSPYSGEFEQAGPHELDRHFNFSPALDPLVWGGAFADDPWPDTMPAVPQVRVVMLSRARRAQRRGTVARLSRRAQFSRAHVGYEIHQSHANAIYVWHIRYQQNPYPATIERFNARCGSNFPTDLPADVIAGVVGFEWMTAEQAEAALAEVEPELVPAYLNVIAAIRSDDLEVTRLLADWATRPDAPEATRGVVANLALEYGWRPLLEQLALAEPEQHLRDQMIAALARPFPETQFNDMGEPTSFYGGDGSDDEDDEYDDDDDDDDEYDD